jgi:hypothetical protein
MDGPIIRNFGAHSAMPQSTPNPGSKELFRYAKVFPPRILDLRARAAAYADASLPIAAGAGAKSHDKSTLKSTLNAWANTFVQSRDYVDDFDALKLRAFDHLKLDAVPTAHLPGKDSIADSEGFAAFLSGNVDALANGRRRLTLSLFAAALLEDRAAVGRLSRALQFLERLPLLAKAEREVAYAPVVLNRYRQAAPKGVDAEAVMAAQDHPPAATQAGRAEILELWHLASEYTAWKKQALHAALEASKHRAFEFVPPKTAGGKTSKKAPAQPLRRARARQHRAYLQSKVETLKRLRAEVEGLSSAPPYARIAALKEDHAFLAHVEAAYGKPAVDSLYNAKPPKGYVEGFCDWYRKTIDAETAPPADRTQCIAAAADPWIEKLLEDRPEVDGRDDIRPLGLAELITVEERWLAYQPGEISAIEPVLKGEVRKKKVKSAQYFEEVTERITEEVSDQEKEQQSKTRQDLNSQIETELSSRFASDINASANGSGGGTIGVVSLEGGASLGANVGFALDTGLSETSESKFSQEILSKAIERTKRSTTDMRRTRSYRLNETRDFHGLDNSAADAESYNAIYCFLDKKICITERVYGVRKFLGAEIVRPGVGLIEKEQRKRALNLSDIGLPPVFDLRPNEISPSNYLALVGKLRAANVSPPPPGVKIVSKTYKTDVTNESREPNEADFKKIADVLTPFFGEYKRFLIQDQIEIPEGYRVQEVRVTVTHGSNGVSIPAHLPFSLLGAAIYALPTVGVAAVPPYTLFYLPLAIWQVLYAASPFLHYNADSSNVTINIGHQTEESPYFFFEPDFLIREIIDAIGSSSIVSGDFIAFLRDRLTALYTAFTATSNNSVADALLGMTDEMRSKINAFITELQNWLANLVTNVIPRMITGGSGSGPALPQIPSLPANVIAEIPKAILAPFKAFFDAIVGHIEDLMQDSLGDIFEYFMAMTSNTDTKVFTGARGFTGTLPVSLNCIALKPGVTVNLSVCMARIDEESLDSWRLETFSRLNQAYYQLLADYEGRRGARSVQPRYRESPGLMRLEEHETLKTRIIATLHRKYSATPDAIPTLDELRLFEHAIDWENISFRLFNYGPSGAQIACEKLGLYDGADERRKQFMNALWSQAMIPLREDERFEQVLIRYLETGVIDFEADLLALISDTDGDGNTLNELTEIYRDLVLQRQRLPDKPPVHRQEVIPTELMIVYQPGNGEPYPVNPAGCG